jgi:tetratricopeptide (TPR) repeat protein
MRWLQIRWYSWALTSGIMLMAAIAWGQAPSAIQLFMPDGSLPSREIRFTLTRDDGLVEILFTDSKGKFLITGSLQRDLDYTITIQGDGRSFDTTTTRFRILRNIAYVTVFLRPLPGDAPPPKEIVDLTLLDAKVPAEARAAYERARHSVAAGNAAEAITDFQRAVSLYPQYLRALNDLGVLYLKLHRLDEAAATFAQAIKVNQRFHYPRLNLGLVLNRQGKHKEAAEVLNRLRKEQPTLTAVCLPLAEALASTGKWQEAERLLREALGDPQLEHAARAEARFKLGTILNRADRFAEAVAELEQAVALAPNLAAAHLQLGGALLQLKRLAEAERALLRAYELGGSEVGGAQLLLGQLYFMQQRFEPARRAFEQYLQDVPAAPNAAQIKDVIEKLRASLKQPPQD